MVSSAAQRVTSCANPLRARCSAWSALATLPIAAWEFSLGVRLIVKGFSPSPLIADDEAPLTAAKELVPA